MYAMSDVFATTSPRSARRAGAGGAAGGGRRRGGRGAGGAPQDVSPATENDRSRSMASAAAPTVTIAAIASDTGVDTRDPNRSVPDTATVVARLYCWMDSTAVPSTRLASRLSHTST